MQSFSYQPVQETTIYIDLPGTKGLRVKGVLRGELTQPVAVIMHGRPGSGNELLPFLGAHHLYEQGIASLRLWMYDFDPTCRNQLDCTLDTHVADFEAVVDYLRKQGVPKVFGIGHSYGGITILKSAAKLDGAVLWDPTHLSYYDEHPDPDPRFPEVVVNDMVIGTAGYGYVLSKPNGLDYDKAVGDTTQWAAGKGYPLKVISAGKGVMTHLGRKYIEVADAPKEQEVIPDAHHQFEDSDEVMLALFESTGVWLKRFC